MLFLVIGQGLHLYNHPSQGKYGKIILPPQSKYGHSSVSVGNDNSLEQPYLFCDDIEDDDVSEFVSKKIIDVFDLTPVKSYRSILSFLHKSYTHPPIARTVVTCKYILQRVLLL